jgi:RNA polymerase sigma-70 factor (ECF subfamily)
MRVADVGSTSSAQLRAIRDWGDHQAWLEFQDKYRPLLRSHCKSLKLDEPTADEICQLTWIEVARRIKRFEYDPSRSFRGWLRTVCTNKAHDYLKKSKRDLVLPFEERDEASEADDRAVFGSEPPLAFENEPSEDPVAALWRRRAEEVQAAVRAKVKPHIWEAFWLLAVRSWSIDETVAALGISHFSAYKAKERVTRQLKEEGRRRFDNGGEPGR